MKLETRVDLDEFLVSFKLRAMEDKFKETVVSLYKQNRWSDVLHLNVNSGNEEIARSFLWVWPSVENFNFIKDNIMNNNLSGLISIGCGCGLLEWMFREYSKMDVLGYEINKEWWTSKYSAPLFIDLIYPNLNNNLELNSKYALLFCYFNDGTAFNKYIRNYGGNLVFIIGPGEGKGTHTDPQPFKPNFECSNWTLCAYQEVKNTKDFIAAYIRNSSV